MNETTNLPTRREPKLPVAFSEGGVQLKSLDEAFRFAEAVAQSGVAPSGLKTPVSVLVVMQMGMELGYTPMQAIRNVWAGPDGKPNEYVESAWARVLASGLVEDWSQEVDDRKATFKVKRKGVKSELVSTFTFDQAERAGISKPGGNWHRYRERMLLARAKGYAIKDAFPDVVRGMEIADRPADDYYRGPERAKDVTPPSTPDPLLKQLGITDQVAYAEGDGAADGSQTEPSAQDSGSLSAAPDTPDIICRRSSNADQELFSE